MKFPHTVTRVRAPLVAGYGGQVIRDWANAVSTSGLSASVQAESASELTEHRQTTVTAWKLYLPAGSSLLATDRIEWSGVTDPDTGAVVPLEVDGEVEDWSRGERGHVKARLTKVATGA